MSGTARLPEDRAANALPPRQVERSEIRRGGAGIEGVRLAHRAITEAGILESIPHREPFLFVDEVVEVGERHIRARKYIDPSSEFFRGHYPGEPMMPGVLLCECCFQAGALLMSARARGSSPSLLAKSSEARSAAAERGSRGVDATTGNAIKPVLTRIQDARFKRIVRPGEMLDIEVSLDDEVDNAFYMAGRASVSGEMAVRVNFACMAKDSEREA